MDDLTALVILLGTMTADEQRECIKRIADEN